MPRLKPATQAQRREHILDAAEQCFARAGFHGTTMHDICREAAVSPGALYVYFASKELLISGIAERNQTKLQEQLEDVARSADLLQALQRLADHYVVEEPHYKRALIIELGAESTRNAAVGAIVQATNAAVERRFLALFERARADGRIAPTIDVKTLNAVLHVIGDGLFWRRAVDPAFDAAAVMPAIMGLMTQLMNPTTAALDRSDMVPRAQSVPDSGRVACTGPVAGERS
jgi:TetR/AcrR family transcriptional regulator, repressor for uid operon